MRVYNSLLLLLALLALAACSNSDSGRRAPIVRLDTAVYNFHALDSARKAVELDSLRPWLEPYFAVMRMPSPDVETLDWLSQSEAVQRFEPDVLKQWPNLDALERQAASIVDAAPDCGLQLPPLSFATVVWGYNQSIARADSVVLIALNHYLGADYPGYSHWETYIRCNKTPEMLPYNLAEAIAATEHPYADEHPTVLSRMLYEGALVRAMMLLVPDAKEHMALGYTPEQLAFAKEKLREMWQEMAAAKMVYDTDPVAIDRLTAPAPSSPLLGLQAPGRIGRYIGYEIVNKYVQAHPDASLAYLLTPAFYANPQSLITSGF